MGKNIVQYNCAVHQLEYIHQSSGKVSINRFNIRISHGIVTYSRHTKKLSRRKIKSKNNVLDNIAVHISICGNHKFQGKSGSSTSAITYRLWYNVTYDQPQGTF